MANTVCTSCGKKKVTEAAREYCTKNEYPILCHTCQQDKGYNKYQVHTKQEREASTEYHVQYLINQLTEQLEIKQFNHNTYESAKRAVNHFEKEFKQDTAEYQAILTKWINEYNKPEHQEKIQAAQKAQQEYIRKTKLPRLNKQQKEKFYKVVSEDAKQVIEKFLAKYQSKPLNEWNNVTVMTEELLKKRIQQMINVTYPELNPIDRKEFMEVADGVWYDEWRYSEKLDQVVPDFNYKNLVSWDNDGVIRFNTTE